MITILDSFSIGVRMVLPISEDSCIFDSFSLGVRDRRYPKSSLRIIDTFSIGCIKNIDFREAKIIRVK